MLKVFFMYFFLKKKYLFVLVSKIFVSTAMFLILDVFGNGYPPLQINKYMIVLLGYLVMIIFFNA